MILGLLIVIVISGLVVNYFQKNRGKIDIPGIVSDNKVETVTKTTPGVTETKTVVLTAGQYSVKRGDSLWKIASSQLGSGYRWQEIAKLNNLKNPSILKTGQVLNLPEKSQLVAEKNDGAKIMVTEAKDYTVVRNDSLWKIAVKTYGDGFRWTQIYNENKLLIKNPSVLRVGMKLRLPASSR